METQRTQFSFLSPNTSDKGPPIRRHIGVLGSAAAVAVGGGAGLLAVSAGVASAASFTVTNCNDSGAGSLRQAVLDSEAASGADTISISAVCDASGAVSVSGVMNITDSLAIVGPGAASFILDGQGSTQIFNVAGTGVEDVVLSGMTITNGKIVGNRGGAIEFDRLDSLSIDDVAFRGNESTSTGGAAVVHWINEVS
ncbi:MAG TPA: hypothetical protein DEB20_06935, partial [Acidimicrobiaceae bacterium]|nr:hypothetical protein [Acidimicrobiaceae bacterium]